MKELTLTQQYILCTWKQDGKFPVFGREKLVCFSAAGVLELLLAGVLALDGKTLTVQSALPETRAFLRPVYDLVQAKQPVKWETVVKYFSASFTGKRIQAWLHLVGDSLAQEGCVQKTTGGSGSGRGANPSGTLGGGDAFRRDGGLDGAPKYERRFTAIFLRFGENCAQKTLSPDSGKSPESDDTKSIGLHAGAACPDDRGDKLIPRAAALHRDGEEPALRVGWFGYSDIAFGKRG